MPPPPPSGIASAERSGRQEGKRAGTCSGTLAISRGLRSDPLLARSTMARSPSPAALPFTEHCTVCVESLRLALRGLYAGAGLDISKPQDVCRQIRIDKNLSWKIARIVSEEDPLAAAALVPGPEGIAILTDALKRHGAHAKDLDTLSRSVDAFELMIRHHAEDRPTFQRLLDGVTMGSSLELSRKTAFRGLSGIWGVQAKARIMAHFLMPNADNPALLDMAMGAALVDVRRMRAVSHWPIFRFQNYSGSLVRGDASATPVDTVLQPLEPPSGPGEPALIMRRWCSPPDVRVESEISSRGIVHQLSDGPLGRTGDSTFVFGYLHRGAAGRFSEKDADPRGEIGASVTMPIETLVFDLIAHKELREVAGARVEVIGSPFGTAPADAAGGSPMLLPISERLVELDVAPHTLRTDLWDRYTEMIGWIFTRIGADPSDFRVFRMTMQYPPMPSTVMVSYELPSRSDTASRG